MIYLIVLGFAAAGNAAMLFFCEQTNAGRHFTRSARIRCWHRAAASIAHTMLRDPRAIAGTEFSKVRELPLTKIVDTPHLAEKGQSAALQVATFAPISIMRRILRRTDSQEFFEPFAPQLIWFPPPEEFGDSMGTEQSGGRAARLKTANSGFSGSPERCQGECPLPGGPSSSPRLASRRGKPSN